MTVKVDTAGQPADVIRLRRSRLRKFARTGCIPLALLGPCAVVGFINLVAFWRAPSWVNDPRTYLLTNRLIVSLVALTLIQIIAHWTLGLVAARSGANLLRTGGQWLRPRFRVSTKRVRVAAIGVMIIRMLLLAALAISVVFAITRLFGRPLYWDSVQDVWDAVKRLPLLAILSGGLFLVHWIVGPILRLRYSAALGMLASTWATREQERTWYAFTARLGAGLVGILTLVWGAALIVLLLSSFYDPSYSSSTNFPELFRGQPSYLRGVFSMMLLATISVPVYALGQLIIPELYLRLARQRLAAGQKNPLPDGQGT